MDSSQIETRIYTPGRKVGWGFSFWREMFARLAGHRQLAGRLFLRDFVARYKQSVLGYLWAVILPLSATGVFVFLSRAQILNVGEMEVPYPVYALLGLTIWQFFAGGIIACTQSIVLAGSMATKVNFPREIIVVVAYGHVVFDALIRLALVAVMFALFGVVPSWTVIFFPLAMAPLILLALGLGLVLSLLNALVRDTGNAVGLVTMLLLFITPVLYNTREGIFSIISRYNPLAGLIGGARDLVISGHMADPVSYVWASLFSLLVFLLSWRIFYLAESRVAERLGAL
jgi:homopolymeric O-antigen transport system permease protein